MIAYLIVHEDVMRAMLGKPFRMHEKEKLARAIMFKGVSGYLIGEGIAVAYDIEGTV